MSKFFERFPKYALLASQHKAKEFDPLDLTGWEKRLEIAHVDVLYVFGVHPMAYAQLRNWLHERSDRSLVFLEKNMALIAQLLTSSFDFFEDLQIDFAYLPSVKAEHTLIEELAEKYPARRIEAVSLSEKLSAREQRIRLALLRKTALSYALFTDRLHGHQPFENFVRNTRFLEGAFYANAMKGAFEGYPAIVCGAGPSLEQAIALLKKLEGRAIVIAGGSAIAALSSAGYEPHFGVAIDPNLEEYRRFRSSFCFECPLLISTRVFPAIFNTCNGPFGYLRSGIGGVCELWLEEQLGLQEPLLGKNLSEESISVTSIAIAFAQHIGCNRILLSGVDLAYTGGKHYASGVSEEILNLKKMALEKSAADQIVRRKDKKGRALYTAVRWLMEASSISHYAKKHPEIHWINTTEGGLSIDGLQEISLESAFSIYLTKQWDLRGQIAAEIASHPMPSQNPRILQELQESLQRTVGHLEVLAKVRSGSMALAEYELKEELAVSILFYDMEKVLSQALLRKERNKWELYLEIARKYL